MPPRFSLARRKAAELLRVGRVKKLPVPVERLAHVAGAKIQFEPFEGRISGMVHRSPDGSTIIGVNSSHAETRQRFTIAHELGHMLLHKDEKFHVDESASIRFRDEESSLATKSEEIEANQFAAELLMPANLMAEEVDKLPDGVDPEDAVPILAARFQVSEQALTLRLSRLGFLV
jgi:Zn-dependent peptidase ImmA (M78 family)